MRPLSHSHGGFDGLSLAWSAKKSKPQCELHYEGSCAIKGERGSVMISVNGSAARRASVGDLLIIASFAQVAEAHVAKHEPQLVFVDEPNQQVSLRHHVPTQAAPRHGTDEC